MLGAFFDFSRLLVVLLLTICTCAYLHQGFARQYMNARRTGFSGLFWKFARIGERLSPYVAVSCVCMAFHMLFIKTDAA